MVLIKFQHIITNILSKQEIMQRLIVAFILINIFIISTFVSTLFHLLALTIAILTAYELTHLVSKKNIYPYQKNILATIALIIIVYYLSYSLGFIKQEWMILVALISFICISINELFDYKNILNNLSIHTFILAYTLTPIIAAIELQQNYLADLFFICFITWINDSVAYLVGRKLGKLYSFQFRIPVSPNKTLIGFIAGTLGCVLSAMFFQWLLPEIYSPDRFFLYSYPWLIILCTLLSLTGHLSDLIESGLKRNANVKDSQYYFAAHGGILDILDSLIYNLPIFYVLLILS